MPLRQADFLQLLQSLNTLSLWRHQMAYWTKVHSCKRKWNGNKICISNISSITVVVYGLNSSRNIKYSPYIGYFLCMSTMEVEFAGTNFCYQDVGYLKIKYQRHINTFATRNIHDNEALPNLTKISHTQIKVDYRIKTPYCVKI